MAQEEGGFAFPILYPMLLLPWSVSYKDTTRNGRPLHGAIAEGMAGNNLTFEGCEEHYFTHAPCGAHGF